MSTLRRRILVTAALPAAALGFLLAAPGAAAASPVMSPASTARVADHDHDHHYGLHLNILLNLHLGGHGHHDDCHGGLLGGLFDRD